MLTNVFAFFIALITSIILIPVIRKLALQQGFVDQPGPRKVHVAPMPVLGGLAIHTAAVLSIVLFIKGNAPSQTVAILGGATLLASMGILDDAGKLHHQVKFQLGMPLAGIILIASGIHSSLFPIPLLDYGITLVWVIGIVCAFNLLDNMDGLCAGVASIASVFFLLFAALNGQYLVSTLAAAVLGAAVGFLYYNFNPARIFMGDGGALFLGFMMATLGIKLRFPDLPQATSWMIPVLILGVPIFDTTLVTISRIRRGLVPFKSPGKDHLSHRLANLGYSQPQVALLHYGLGLVLGLLALLVTHLSTLQAYALAGVLTCLGAVGIGWLERLPFERQGPSKR